MAAYVRKGHCGTCEYFDEWNEDENCKGHCDWYKTYYYCDDFCDHWKEKEGSSWRY